MIPSLRRLRVEVTSFLALLNALSGFGGFSEAAKGPWTLSIGIFVFQGFAKAAFGVMSAYRRVSFGHGDSCGERKGLVGGDEAGVKFLSFRLPCHISPSYS